MSASKKLNIQKLGIIAGGGDLPHQLVSFCQAHHIPHTVLGIKGHVDSVNPDSIFRIGQSSKILQFFKDQHVSDIVFIGSVTKPNIFTLWPDWRAFKFFLSAWLHSFGDDGLLKAARKILEEEGFKLCGIHHFLPHLLMPEGVLGQVTSSVKYQSDIQLGLKKSQELGKNDIGQAVLVKDGNVIAKEGKKGTNAMIKKYGEAGAILVKTCKPQQDRDLDLPTLGLKTVNACAAKNMAGIVGQAGLTLLVDQDKMIKKANEQNIFIMGVSLYE